MASNHFKVIVPAYNCEKWIEKCLDSIFEQTYKNFQLVIIDDGSTDKTLKHINDKLTQGKNGEGIRYTLIHNEENQGSPILSFIKGLKISSSNSNNPEDILITVDGDDWLYSNDVFEYLNEVYQDPNIWLTYGEFEPTNQKYHRICRQVQDTQIYRRDPKWYTSHLRTFKKWLFDKIDDRDLRDPRTGEYFKTAGDLAIMYPLIEMAGKKHIKFIEKFMYWYNNENELNEMNCKLQEQLETAQLIKSKDIYKELTIE